MTRVCFCILLLCLLSAVALADVVVVTGKMRLEDNWTVKLSRTALPGDNTVFATDDQFTSWFPSKPTRPKDWMAGWAQIGYVEGEKLNGRQVARYVRKIDATELPAVAKPIEDLPCTLSMPKKDTFEARIGGVGPFEVLLSDEAKAALKTDGWEDKGGHSITVLEGAMLALWGGSSPKEIRLGEKGTKPNEDTKVQVEAMSALAKVGDGAKAAPLPLPLSLRPATPKLPLVSGEYAYSGRDNQVELYQHDGKPIMAGTAESRYPRKFTVPTGFAKPSPATAKGERSQESTPRQPGRPKAWVRFEWGALAQGTEDSITLEGAAWPLRVTCDGTSPASLEYWVVTGGVIRIDKATPEPTDAPGSERAKEPVWSSTKVTYRVTPLVLSIADFRPVPEGLDCPTSQ
jgi:hypothetical protein